jgi:CheY-like chemotaxis protein
MSHTRLRPVVLLVEDYPDTRELYRHYLAASGYQVEEAADGHTALDKAFRLQPDLILMDLSIPGIDGWDVTARLKRDERTAQIPVVAVTAHALGQEMARAFAVGCLAVVIKPCLPSDLVTEVERVLRSHTRGGPGGHPTLSGSDQN